MSIERDTMIMMIHGSVEQAADMIEIGHLAEGRTHLIDALKQYKQLAEIERQDAEIEPPKQLTINI